MVKRIVVGAHYGLRDWLAQRITAIYMVAYTALFVGILLGGAPLDYPSWKALFSGQLMRLLTVLFFLSLMLHAWVGVRDILMDYVRAAGLRLLLEAVVILVLVGNAAWALQILWRL